MVSASFVQTDFRGGEWSPLAQGRVADPGYKTGNNVMFNAVPLEAGGWTRRSGARFLAHTKAGAEAALLAFDFSVEQPYILELTDSWLRFFAGLDLLTWRSIEGPLLLAEILPLNPAKVVMNTTIPAGWANGSTVVFQLNSIPVTSTDVLGRQFVIANLDTTGNTFTLQDPLTGLDVDGSAWTVYSPPTGSTPDTVERVFELPTPYGAGLVHAVLAVQDDDNVLLIHHGHQPELVTAADDAPFAIAPQDFMDGPYLDIVEDGLITLSLSGLTGSVTVTASGTTDINNGLGFKISDIGRLIRFQGGPAAWVIGTTYNKDDVVLGSDNNVYTSLTGGNVGNNPTTDNTGTNWQISPITVTWTWLKITAWTSSTAVTAMIMGVDLPQAAATTQWQLGLYSETTGWPAVGTYHEGRLWLAGSAVGFTNRVDGSVSNDPFNFAPTGVDGTVSDANAVAAIFRAKEANVIFWMISTSDGLMLGTQAGEWRIKASALDDPISATSIQARRVSTYGCANMQPVQPGGQTVFVQRQQRRLLAHQQNAVNSYFAANLSQNADHVTAGGIAEIMWQQEPNLCVWARLENNNLIGCTYQERQYSGYAVAKEPFNGFHRHLIGTPGLDRNVTSIQSSPAFDGLSDALYMVTNQARPNQPDHGIRWVQVFMPVFDAAIQPWGAYFTDGGANPPYAQLFQTVNGDAFNGVTIYGLWPLNGQTVAPVLGGLDLGDRVVSNGSVSVPFGTDPDKQFTLAFFTGLSDGTNYSIFTVQAGSVVSGSPTNPNVPNNSLIGFVGPDTTVKGSHGTTAHIDRAHNTVIECIIAAGGHSTTEGGLRKIDSNDLSGTFGNELLQAGNAAIFSDGSVITTDISYLHADGHIYMTGTRGNSNSSRMSKISTTTLLETASYGIESASLAGSTSGRLQLAFTSMTGLTIGANNYLIFCGIRGVGVVNEVTALQTDGTMDFKAVIRTDENLVSVTRGPDDRSCFAVGMPYSLWAALWLVGTTYITGDIVMGSDGLRYSSVAGSTGVNPVGDAGVHWTPIAGQVGLYQIQYDESTTSLLARRIKKINPHDIDATWITMNSLIGPATDGRDILCLCETADSVTNQHYLVKFSGADGHVLWKVALPTAISNLSNFQAMSVADFACTAVFVATTHNAYIVDMKTGTLTTQAINTGFSVIGSQYYDCASGSITLGCNYTSPGSGPALSYLGTYLPANGDDLVGQWARLYLGLSCCGDTTVTTYTIPVSLGCTYTSQGQLLRPDFGNDAGARNGPAFGKKRRNHWFAGEWDRSRGVSIGTVLPDPTNPSAPTKLHPVKFASDGGIPLTAPALFSGIATDTIRDDESFYGRIAWQITRPYPCNLTALSGYIESADK